MNQEVGAQCKAVGGSTRYSGGRSVTGRHSMGDSQCLSEVQMHQLFELRIVPVYKGFC